MGPQDCFLPVVGTIVRLCALYLACALFVLATCGIALNTASGILTEYYNNISNALPMIIDEHGSYLERTAVEKLVGPQGPHPDDMQSKSALLYSYATKLDYAMQAMIITSKFGGVTSSGKSTARRVAPGSPLPCQQRHRLPYHRSFCILGRHRLYLRRLPPPPLHLPRSRKLRRKESRRSFSALTLLPVWDLAQQPPTDCTYRVESAVLYPATLFAFTVLTLVDYGAQSITYPVLVGLEVTKEVLRSCLTSIMGIASTLTIVRIALGIAINDEESFRATVLGEGDVENGGTRGIIDSVLNIRRPNESGTPRDEGRVEGL
ncbi:hypothetical protein PM082_022243 [Marasmius tenuissimus]|nr:hypothetical protein PM082_022243 [Marasmius tenuissimus]